MTARFRAGIVGAGFMGTVHAHAVRAVGGVVSRVAGRTLDEAEQAAARMGAERPAASIDDLVAADDVDAVHICIPNKTHLPLAEAVLRAGRHVVCEKPLATDPDDARRLTEAAADAGAQGYHDSFTAFVSDVYAAVAGHKPEGLPTFADGLRAAVLTQAVVDSTRDETWVEVPA
ncbi:Gfo/Idh/MocA family protein [Virgisporangium aurantiacum]|uniref:Gfo/Idh/MocA-like oxidoreductase N-terminal domain-containing protein n=1 Tax=Virgisporangium aurantiacum TaxID=175570 RepID=A0A8J4E689_9ACTN|nr:Gfo/Idh/MocA family oxidoreductase [Virgisporangium aurantiacum]GIJ63176.1 hypothetical protein Vau01_106920 [Virgisporangium aurantiacum]